MWLPGVHEIRQSYSWSLELEEEEENFFSQQEEEMTEGNRQW